MRNSYNSKNYDVAIIGGGMVGLCIANQLVEKNISRKIIVIDKESTLGMHTSGRNSGVLHAGIYYKPNTLKARVCVDGAQRLKTWIQERNLPLNQCGKVIVPTKEHLDCQLDVLFKRGQENGAHVEFWDEDDLHKKVPEARSASGRALWSPNTTVVKPLIVVQKLQQELSSKGVHFKLNEKSWKHIPESREITLNSSEKIGYKHLFNCAGLQADRIAHRFQIGYEYSLMPFKGIYWQTRRTSKIQPKTNIYPVPDLEVPFLGVHFTPSADAQPVVSIGPTATATWGRENYRGIRGFEPHMALINTAILAKQYLTNQGNIRKYVHEQAFLNLSPLFIQAAQALYSIRRGY